MAEGLFLEAIPELKACSTELTIFGINPILDLAACYYSLGDFLTFKKFTIQALELFDRNEVLVTEDDYHGSILGLGRCLQELGMISEAFVVYSRAIDHSTSSRKKKILAERLRLQREFNLKGDWDLSLLTTHKNFIPDGDLEVDVVNALVISSFREEGFGGAFNRLIRACEHQRFSEEDHRFLYFNLFYLELAQGAGLTSGRLLNLCGPFEYLKCDSFEKFVYDLVLILNGQVPLNEVNIDRCWSQSPMCRLRLLHLLSVHNLEGVDSQYAQRQILSTFETLSSKSRSILLEHFQFQKNQDVQFVLRGSRLFHGSKFLELGRAKNQIQIIILFADCSSLSLSEFCKIIFECEFRGDSLKRLSVALTRFNSTMTRTFGVGKVFRWNKSEIVLNPCIRFFLEREPTEALGSVKK